MQHASVGADRNQRDRGHPAEPRGRLREAYERTQPRLWRALLAWSGSRDVADEATAEAFAQAARRIDALRDVDAWIWRSAFRIAAGLLQQWRQRPLPLGDAADVANDTMQVGRLEGDQAALALDLLQALRCLTEQQQACVVLRDVAGLTAPEVADVLGTSAATVRVQLLRSRRRLRTLLEVDDG